MHVFIALVLMAISPAFAQPAPAASNAYVLNRANSKFLFSISHFIVSSTEGKFAAFDGKLTFEPQSPERGTATIRVSTASIDTGSAARDEHLRSADFFDVEKYPSVVFESTGLVRMSGSTGKLTGTLTLHGVSRPIVLNVVLRTPDLAADKLSFSVTTRLKRSDFGMTNYIGMIGDDVSLTIEAEFDRQG